MTGTFVKGFIKGSTLGRVLKMLSASSTKQFVVNTTQSGCAGCWNDFSNTAQNGLL